MDARYTPPDNCEEEEDDDEDSISNNNDQQLTANHTDQSDRDPDPDTDAYTGTDTDTDTYPDPDNQVKSPSNSPASPSIVVSPSFLYFLCLFYAFLTMGVDMALLGPSLLELAYQINGDVSDLAVVFTARSVGLLIGTLIAGYIVDKWRHRAKLCLTVGCAGQLLITAFFPYLTNLYLMIFISLIHGIFIGVCDNTTQILLIRHYIEKVAPYMQALHGAFGVGAFLSPLVLSPFLQSTTATSTTDSTFAYSSSFRYAWLLAAGFAVPSLIWIAYYTIKDEFGGIQQLIQTVTNQNMNNTQTNIETTATESNADENEDEDGLIGIAPDSGVWHEAGQQQSLLAGVVAKNLYRYQLRVVLSIGIFLALYVGCETGFGAYIYSYAVTELQMQSADAAYLNSAYWGCFAVGRIVGIFVSMRFTPQQMVISDLLGCILAIIIIMSFFQSIPALCVGTVLYGASVGSIYASAINYTEFLIGVNGRLLSYLTLFVAAGDALIPLTIGSLFSTAVGPRGLTYVTLIVATTATALFSFLIFCIAKGKRIEIGETTEVEKEQQQEQTEQHLNGIHTGQRDDEDELPDSMNEDSDDKTDLTVELHQMPAPRIEHRHDVYDRMVQPNDL